MPELAASIRSEWRRSNDYEISDGCFSLRPGGSVEAYDPMAVYWASTRERTPRGSVRAESPYQDLFERMHDCEWRTENGKQVLDPVGQSLLLSWVREYGLLGALPHMLVQVSGSRGDSMGPQSGDEILWARDVETFDRCSPELHLIGRGPIRSMTALVQNQTVGMAGGEGGEGSVMHSQEDGLGQVEFQPLGVERVDRCRWEDLGAVFFTDTVAQLDRSTRYPFPDEEGFWTVYREPIDVFWEAATLLRYAFRSCALVSSGEYDLDQIGMNEWTGPRALNLILSRVRPSLRPLGRGWEGTWRSSSLLGILATQAYWDLSRGRKFRPHICPYCEKPFGSRVFWAKYCDDDCRKRDHRRLQREKARQQHEAG